MPAKVVCSENDSAMGSIDSCIAGNIVQYTDIIQFHTHSYESALEVKLTVNYCIY